MDGRDKVRDDGYKPFDYYNPDVLSNPFFWVNVYQKRRKMIYDIEDGDMKL
jgi:hypothetical protein